MSTKHTRGPWNYNDNSDAGGLVVWAANRDRVARVCWYGKQSETPYATEANARLIAAAPELLEAAQGILVDDMFRYLPNEYIAKVRAAIAKATGS